MRSNRWFGGVLSLVYSIQASALVASGEQQGVAMTRALAPALTINSTVPVDRALKAWLADDDLRDVQEFLKNQKVDLSQVTMSDAPLVDGRIYYRDRSAEVRADGSIKIDGHVLKYDSAKSPAENFKKFFRAFNGKANVESSARLLNALVEPAWAHESNGNYGGNTVVLEGPAFGTLSVAALEGAGLGWAAQTAATDYVNKRASRGLIKGMGSAGNAVTRAESAVAVAEAELKLVTKPKLMDAARAKLATAQAELESAKSEAAKASKGIVGNTRAAVSNVATKGQVTAQKAGAWAKGRWTGLASKLPQGASLRAAGAFIAGSAAMTALAIAGGAVVLSGVVIGGKAWYASLMNGVFECGPADTTGNATYVFNFTSADSSWYWQKTDQRAFTAKDLSAVLKLEGTEALGSCDDEAAKRLTERLRATGEKVLAEAGAESGAAKSAVDKAKEASKSQQ